MLPTYYLSYAGFYIRVVFGPCENSFYRKKWINDFLNNYGYCLSKKAEPYSHTVIFAERDCYPIIFKENQTYILFQTKKTKGLTEVYYAMGTAQFESVLEEVVQTMLEKNGGFFFHCSALINGSSAIIFTGPSGAGKSTIAHLLRGKGNVSFCDDLCVVRPQFGEYYAYQSLYRDKASVIKKTAKGYKVTAVFFLHQSKINIVKKITDQKILTETQKQVIFRIGGEKQTTKHVCDFVFKKHFFHSLHFSLEKQSLCRVILPYALP